MIHPYPKPLIHFKSQVMTIDMLNKLLNICTALSTEKDISLLLEKILGAAMDVTNADAASIYRASENKNLVFEIVHNKSKGIHLGGKSAAPIKAGLIPLFNSDGTPDLSRVVCNAFHRMETINIADAYNDSIEFDLSGTHEFDATNQYHSKSFLTIPMKNHESEIIGVLQLINAIDRETGEITSFLKSDELIVEALASQAAVAITNRMLINHLENLFESFISLINEAIDDKSPHTGGHCNRVPDLTMMLADAVNRCSYGPLNSFTLSEEDRHELKIAGLLHDCGKITTPVHVVDKATKLEGIFDRIGLIETRAEIIFRDIKIAQSNNLISKKLASDQHQQLIEDCNFLNHCNIGVESMQDADIERVHSISANYRWEDLSGKIHPFLSNKEIENLTIRAGTLTPNERLIINHHIESTIAMLEELPWPKHLKNVPEYAGGHHERMDGKGYPKGLKRTEMSIQARCMGIADIFEALTAKDRPYKKGKTLSESLEILGKMKLGQHVDPDLFDIFIWEKVYEEYAHKFLDESQIDIVDLNKIPGYNPPPADYQFSKGV